MQTRDNLSQPVSNKVRIGKLSISRNLLKILISIIFFVGLYFLVSPFLPRIKYNLFDKGKVYLTYDTQIENLIKEQADKNSEKVVDNKKGIPEGRRLVIPSINVDLPILEGVDESTLSYGVWWRPGTGDPIKGSNMVLTGHRLGYGFLPQEIQEQSSFYNLDKVKIGDYIIVYWDGKEYDYQISTEETVLPTEARIENPTDEPQLTLYTCTPVGINSHRLVKYAKPINMHENSTTVSSSKSTTSSASSI